MVLRGEGLWAAYQYSEIQYCSVMLRFSTSVISEVPDMILEFVLPEEEMGGGRREEGGGRRRRVE
eukprot:3548329-Rhodomonas_salina.1